VEEEGGNEEEGVVGVEEEAEEDGAHNNVAAATHREPMPAHLKDARGIVDRPYQRWCKDRPAGQPHLVCLERQYPNKQAFFVGMELVQECGTETLVLFLINMYELAGRCDIIFRLFIYSCRVCSYIILYFRIRVLHLDVICHT